MTYLLVQKVALMLSDILRQIGQIPCVILLAPLLQEFILKAEERSQRAAAKCLSARS
jgi:hypothetical protein